MISRCGFALPHLGHAGGAVRPAPGLLVSLVFIFALAIVNYIGGQDEHEESFRAPRGLLWTGIVGNFMLLVYVVVGDPFSLVWCAGLLAVGGVLYASEYLFGNKERASSPAPVDR